MRICFGNSFLRHQYVVETSDALLVATVAHKFRRLAKAERELCHVVLSSWEYIEPSKQSLSEKAVGGEPNPQDFDDTLRFWEKLRGRCAGTYSRQSSGIVANSGR